MSDADAISYLNRTTVPVMCIESLRTQLAKFSRPLQMATRRCMRCAAPHQDQVRKTQSLMTTNKNTPNHVLQRFCVSRYIGQVTPTVMIVSNDKIILIRSESPRYM